MISLKLRHPFLKDWIELVSHAAGARTYASIEAAGSAETDAAHSIVHELDHQFLT